MKNLEELDPIKEQKQKETPVSKKPYLIVVGLCFLFALLLFRQARVIIKTPISSWTEDQRADCALVFTGGAARISEGFSLLSQQRVKKLIISGVNPSSGLYEIFPQLVFYGNVSTEDILLEKRSRTTYGNAQQSAVLIDALNCKDLVLVTSWQHMYRASNTLKSSLPEGFPIYERSVIYGQRSSYSMEVFAESVKGIFYGLWAY